MINRFLFIFDNQVGFFAIVPEVALSLVFSFTFSGVVALMSAEITRDLWSLVCSSLNSYYKCHFSHFDFISNRMLSALNWMFPSMIMDLLLFAIIKWASLMVDIHCPSGHSKLSISIHFSGLVALMSDKLHETYVWSLVCSSLNSCYKCHLFPLLILFQTGCFLHWIESFSPMFYSPLW